jgi:hypothetical protein
MPCYVHPRHFVSRSDMLSLVPQGATVAEIGVFDGAFSQQILDRVRPSQLVLIDLWADEDVLSGDVNGDNLRTFNGRALERMVRERFEAVPEARIIRGTSDCLRLFPDSYFDAVYIDADHTYGAVRRDLFASLRALKAGGWLMGHDYGVNRERTDARWEFGVRTAVDDFCKDQGMEIDSFGMDGLTSFAIQVRKEVGLFDSVACCSRRMGTDVRRLVRSAASRLSKTIAG